MKCVIGGHADSVIVNKIDKYCWIHYQLYDSLLGLYLKVFQAYGPLSWADFLSIILDNKAKHPWKQHITTASGAERNSMLEVVSYERSLIERSPAKLVTDPKELMDEIVQTNGNAIVFIDSEVIWGRYREFWPEEVRISVGNEVTWKNKDNNGLRHRIRFSNPVNQNSKSGISSEELSYGQSFSHQFEMKGIFEYYCDLQGQSVVGRIVVV